MKNLFLPVAVVAILAMALMFGSCEKNNEEKGNLPDNENPGGPGGGGDDDAGDDDAVDDDVTDDDAADDDTTADINLLIIYNGDPITVTNYESALNDTHIIVTGLLEKDVQSTTFPAADVILVDTSTNWYSPESANRVGQSGIPLLGMYYGGGYLFDALGLNLGWGDGFIDDGESQVNIKNAGHPVFNTPVDLGVQNGDLLTLFQDQERLLYHDEIGLTGITFLADRPVDTDWTAITIENGKYMYWGFETNPIQLTAAGKQLLINCIYFLSTMH